MESSKLFDVRGLRHAYGERVAVDGIDFSVGSSEIFGLLGPNGAGKTTTLACISGLVASPTGAMEFSGKSFAPWRSMDDRRSIGIVPQELAIYENLTAAENLRFLGKVMRIPASTLAEQVEKLLHIAGLESRRNDLVSEYSGGMKRRLNLVSSLIHSPQLVLMDEPTAGVDPQSRNHLFESIQSIKDLGTSIIYTTHYMEEAERLCDRIAIMNEGKIVATGTCKSLAEQTDAPESNLETVFLKLTGRTLRD